jgi:hypothetical protein
VTEFVVGQKVRIKAANINNFYAVVQPRIGNGRVGEVLGISGTGRISVGFAPVGRKQEYRLRSVPPQFLEAA